MATQLEELKHDLEWIEYRLMSARGDMSDLARNEELIDDEEGFHVVLAFAASFRRIAADLAADVEKLQTATLNEWHQRGFDGGAYWDRSDSRFRAKAIQFSHEARGAAEA